MADVYDRIDERVKPRPPAVLEIPRPRPPLGPGELALIVSVLLVATFFILVGLLR